MAMRYIVYFFLLVMPTVLYAQPTPINVKPLYHYDFVGINIDLKPGVNCFVITNHKQMEKFFGKTNRPDTPDFSKEQVLVLLVPPAKKDAKLSFDRINMKAGNFVEVYCTTKLNLGRLTYTATPVAVCTIPIYPGVEKVKFYNDDMRLIKAVDVK